MTGGHGRKMLPGLEALCRANHEPQQSARFGRMFGELDPLWVEPKILTALGAPDGPMKTAATPARTKSVPAGFVFLGQFIDHDITLDITTSLDGVSDGDIPNARTPTLDLDCVYGAGPEASRHLYHSDGDFKGVKLITARDLGVKGAGQHDLARVGNVALIGDFRNDENRIVSQLQLAMIRYHNQVCDDLFKANGLEGEELFAEARRHCTWHYQSMIVREFLPTMCGGAVVNRILAHGPRFFRPDRPFIPVEFSVAAYRFGHAMVPQKVRVRKGGSPFPLFGPELGGGFSPVPSDDAVVEWGQLFDISGKAQRSHRCGPKLAKDLLTLSAGLDPDQRSLATRNMERGQQLLLPSGEAVAKAMEIDSAHIKKVSNAAAKAAKSAGVVLPDATPLWYWILTEAGVIGRQSTTTKFEPGEGLGPVGGTIVAEVLLGLMKRDPRSWLSVNRTWEPEADQRTIGQIVTHANVVDVRDGTKVA